MCAGIACPVTTVTSTVLGTLMILFVRSGSLHVILHLLAVAGFICNRHDRQRKCTTQWRNHQGKGDKNQD